MKGKSKAKMVVNKVPLKIIKVPMKIMSTEKFKVNFNHISHIFYEKRNALSLTGIKVYSYSNLIFILDCPEEAPLD